MFVFITCNVYKTVLTIDSLQGERSEEDTNSSTAREQSMGAFHSTKFSGLKFRVFYATNGTVFSGSLD